MKTPEIDNATHSIRAARAVVLAWATLFALAATAEPMSDGPYVMRAEKGGWVARFDRRRRLRAHRSGGAVSRAAVRSRAKA